MFCFLKCFSVRNRKNKQTVWTDLSWHVFELFTQTGSLLSPWLDNLLINSSGRWKESGGNFLWLFGWDTEPMADEVLNDRWRALGEAPACQTHTVSLSDIIRKMLSPCACVMFKGWNYIFTVNKLLVSRVTCFVRLLYIIVFNDSPGVQAGMSDKPTACWFLSAAIALCVE